MDVPVCQALRYFSVYRAVHVDAHLFTRLDSRSIERTGLTRFIEFAIGLSSYGQPFYFGLFEEDNND